MAITAGRLTQAAGVCAAVAGAIFIGVNINHPHVDVGSITTTELVIRNSLKLLMCALALAGITGMYLSRVRRNGVLGLIGYLVLATGYLLIMSTTFVTAYVLPSIAATDPTYVKDVIAVATGGTATGDIGALETINQVQGFAYLAGGLLLRHRAVPGTRSGPVGGRAPRGRWGRQRRALRDAGRLLPPAGIPERHRDDRPRLLAVEHGPQGRPDATRRGR